MTGWSDAEGVVLDAGASLSACLEGVVLDAASLTKPFVPDCYLCVISDSTAGCMVWDGWSARRQLNALIAGWLADSLNDWLVRQRAG